MIQPQTNIKIMDNSSVKSVRCVHVEKKNYNSFAHAGDTLLGVVTFIKKKNNSKSTYKKGDLVRVLLTSCKKERKIANSGFFFKNMTTNVGILVQPFKKKQQGLLPSASRFESFLPQFFKNSSFKNFNMYSNLLI